jgi:Replication initiator protein A
MATIWDADVLIWAASQIVEARDGGLKTSLLMAATPREILTFVGRGTSAKDYDPLKAALDRLQSTAIMTSIRQPTERRCRQPQSSGRRSLSGLMRGINHVVTSQTSSHSFVRSEHGPFLRPGQGSQRHRAQRRSGAKFALVRLRPIVAVQPNIAIGRRFGPEG